MDLATIGTIVTISYIVGIILTQWISDCYFNVTDSKMLDQAYFICYYWLNKFQKEQQDNA